MFKKLKLNSAKARLVEERLYEMVMDELETGNIRKGIWGKALAQSNGNDNQARSKYLELRVESLKDEAHVIQSILESDAAKPEPKPELVKPEPKLVKPESEEVGGSPENILVFCVVFVFFFALFVSNN